MTALSGSTGSLRASVEDFLYDEAALLDAWRLDEWMALFTEDSVYMIPATDMPEGDPNKDLYLVYDDCQRLRTRVKQLLEPHSTWAEHPQSRTRRHISNVRVAQAGEADVHVHANFIVHRFRVETTNTFIGRYEYVLGRAGETFRIRSRKAILDAHALRPPATLISIIV